MRNLILGLGLLAISGVASAQWAVLDEKVRLLVEKINFVGGEGVIRVRSCLLPLCDLVQRKFNLNQFPVDC